MKNPEFSSFFHKIVINSLLGHVRNIFCKCHLHNASKKVFWPKKFWIPCSGPKVPFCQNWKKNWPKDFCEAIWSWHVKNISNMSQGLPNPGFRSVRVKTEIFSKRTHKISKFLFNVGFYESLARLESKIRKCLFFDGSKL